MELPNELVDVEPSPEGPGEAAPAARVLVAEARALRTGLSEALAAPAIRLRAARLKVVRRGKVVAENPPQTARLFLPGRPASTSFELPMF